MRHVTTVRARYAETDRAGVVYHASFLYWFEIGRTELMRESGYAYSSFERERGLLLTVAEAQLSFKSPARYDDLIRIESWLTGLRRVGFSVRHRLLLDGTDRVLATGSVLLACVDPSGKVRAIPEDVRAALEPWVDDRDQGKDP